MRTRKCMQKRCVALKRQTMLSFSYKGVEFQDMKNSSIFFEITGLRQTAELLQILFNIIM